MKNKIPKLDLGLNFFDIIIITFGSAMYAFSIVFFNITNKLADGGVTGVTLILRAVFGVDPAISTILINIPLFIIGYRYLGKKDMIFTLYGTITLSVFLWIWQRVPIVIDIKHDMLIASIAAGLIGGFGCGLVYRYGGTTGGIDIIARLFERFKGIPMGKSLLIIDVGVLLSSLIYLNVVQMAYTMIYIWIFTIIIDFTQQGAYAARAIIIVSNQAAVLADEIMLELSRGVTFLNAEGGYSHESKQLIYCVVAPNEIHRLKQIVEAIDKQAFISILQANEAIGEGFTYRRPKKFKLLK